MVVDRQISHLTTNFKIINQIFINYVVKLCTFFLDNAPSPLVRTHQVVRLRRIVQPATALVTINELVPILTVGATRLTFFDQCRICWPGRRIRIPFRVFVLLPLACVAAVFVVVVVVALAAFFFRPTVAFVGASAVGAVATLALSGAIITVIGGFGPGIII